MLVVLGAALMVGASSAFAADSGMSLAWSTGDKTPNSVNGTHGWIAGNAALMAKRHGVGWVNINVAIARSSYPDTVFWDHIDHNANWWGNYPSYYSSSWPRHFGKPQNKVHYYYARMVQALKAGKTTDASIYFGYLSHYYSDCCQPLHTQESALETDARHEAYETTVGRMLPRLSSHSGWLKWDGYAYIPNVSAFTVETATKTHTYYWSLIKEYAAHGFDSKVAKITATSLDRAVNGLSDIIMSAAWDADTVSAYVNGSVPSAITTDAPITISGHGADKHHKIVAYRWLSSIDGTQSVTTTMTTANLSPGLQTISFEVKCSNGKWSAPASFPLIVGKAGTHPLPVYRFVNRATSGRFYTASEAEKRTMLKSSKWLYEGIAWASDASATANDMPLFRFRNLKVPGYFLTAVDAEKTLLQTTQAKRWRLEGPIMNVSLSPTGTVPVYRFHNTGKGVYLWTASAGEKAYYSTAAARKKKWHYDGVAFYVATPW